MEKILLFIRQGVNPRNIEIAIISSTWHFYDKMKLLERFGVPRQRIVDGRIFQIPNLNFQRFRTEGVAYGMFEDKSSFGDTTNVWHPRKYKFKEGGVTLKLSAKSRINSANNLPARIESFGLNNVITFGKFSAIAWNSCFQLALNDSHSLTKVTHYGLANLGWTLPPEDYPSEGQCKIEIGNEVWIGRGCVLKSDNKNKPLVIGDGAAVASNSVVVKSVPPYAIVGGNPAKIIKYRFDEKIIESLLRIKWWDWDIDKLHDNFKYFNRVEEFVEKFDK